MSEKTGEIETLIARIEERESRAKRSIVAWTVIPALFVAVFLAVAWYQLYRMTHELENKKAEAIALQLQEQTLKEKVAAARKEYENLKTNIEKLYSVQVTPQNEVYEVKATAQATGKVTSSGPEYRFAIYINSPQELLNKIARVTYVYDDPSYIRKDEVRDHRGDAGNRFLVRYTGWGCLNPVRVRIFLKDGTEQSVNFDMCKSLGLEWSNPK